MGKINFFKEDILIDLRKVQRFKKWITSVSESYKQPVESINYVFCSDSFLHKINLQYLNHDTFTDIITFDLREEPAQLPIEADIFISVERIKENSRQLNVSYDLELARVMVHGLLHLIGWGDTTSEEKEQMREEESKAILLL